MANNYVIVPEGIDAPNGLAYNGSTVLPLIGSPDSYSTINRDSWDLIVSGVIPPAASISFSLNGQNISVTAEAGATHAQTMQAIATAITETLAMLPVTDLTHLQRLQRPGFLYPDPTNINSLPLTIRIISPNSVTLQIDDIVLEGMPSIHRRSARNRMLCYGVAENPGGWGNNTALQFLPLNLNIQSSVQMMLNGKASPLNTFTCTINGVTLNIAANANGNNALLSDIATAINAGVPNVTATVLQIQGTDANRQIVVTSTNTQPVVISAASVGAYAPTSSVTISIGTPGIVTWANHNLVAGDAIKFSTSGGSIPTGLTAGTTYYVSSTSLTSNTFQVAATLSAALAGTGSIATSGTFTAPVSAAATETATVPAVAITTLQTAFVSPTSFACNIYQYPNMQNIQVSISATFQTFIASNGIATNFSYLVNNGPQSSGFLQVYSNPLAQENNWTIQGTTNLDFTTGAGFMGGGVNGAQSTSADMINAWNLLSDPQQWTIRILMNAGYTTVPVQQNMAQLCMSRQDCFAILDMNSADQENDTTTIAARQAMNITTMYAAIYTPDILIYDTNLISIAILHQADMLVRFTH